MKSKRSFVLGVVVGVVASFTCSVLAYQIKEAYPNEYPIIVNGNQVEIEGYNIDDYSYFKLRDIAKYAGFNVDFKDGDIVINTDDANNSMPDGQINANGKLTTIDGTRVRTYTSGDTVWYSVSDLRPILHAVNIAIWAYEDGTYNLQLVRKDTEEVLVEQLEFQQISDFLCIEKSTFENVVLPLDRELSNK